MINCKYSALLYLSQMVGDDVGDDVGGAMACGMAGVLGKDVCYSTDTARRVSVSSGGTQARSYAVWLQQQL